MSRDDGDSFGTLPLAGFIAFALLSRRNDSGDDGDNQDPSNPDPDPPDGGDDGDGGGNGGGPSEPNVPPTAGFDWKSTGLRVTATNTSEDPDDDVSVGTWRPQTTGGQVFGTLRGEQIEWDFDSPGQYVINLEVNDGVDQDTVQTVVQVDTQTDYEGHTGAGGEDFGPVERDPGNYSNTLRIKNEGETGESAIVEVRTSGPFRIVNPDQNDQRSTDNNGNPIARLNIQFPGYADKIEYEGEITGFSWRGAPIRPFINGTQKDPFRVAGRNNPISWPGEGWFGQTIRSETVEIALWTTKDLYDRHGRAPERAAADWLTTMLQDAGLKHRIYRMLPVMNPFSEGTACCNPVNGRGTACCDSDTDAAGDCSIEGSLPKAVYWFNDIINNTGQIQRAENRIRNNYGQEGDLFVNENSDSFNAKKYRDLTYTLAKDSNVLLTDTGGGGCGFIGGAACAVGADALDGVRPFEEITNDSYGNQIHNVAHEMGHNFGLVHAGDGQGGEGRNAQSAFTNDEIWLRTPTVGCNDCTNACSFFIEPRDHGTAEFDMRYTRCDVNLFEIGSDSSGVPNQAPIDQQYTPDNCTGCDCGCE
jgi:hypothetical protein